MECNLKQLELIEQVFKDHLRLKFTSSRGKEILDGRRRTQELILWYFHLDLKTIQHISQDKCRVLFIYRQFITIFTWTCVSQLCYWHAGKSTICNDDETFAETTCWKKNRLFLWLMENENLASFLLAWYDCVNYTLWLFYMSSLRCWCWNDILCGDEANKSHENAKYFASKLFMPAANWYAYAPIWIN